MLYLEATVKVMPGKMQEFMDQFWNQYAPLCDKICAENQVGRRLVAQWQTSIGRLDEVVDLWAFDDYLAIQRYRDARSKSEEFRQLNLLTRQLIAEETTRLLVPTPRSPMR